MLLYSTHMAKNSISVIKGFNPLENSVMYTSADKLLYAENAELLKTPLSRLEKLIYRVN